MAKSRNQVQATFSDTLTRRLDAYAAHSGLSRTLIIQQALADFLDQKDMKLRLTKKMEDNFAAHIPEIEQLLKEAETEAA